MRGLRGPGGTRGLLRVTLEIACALALLVRSGADYRVAPDKAPVYGAWHTFEGTPSFLAPSASDRTEDENLVWHDAKWNTTGNYWKAVDGFAATTLQKAKLFRNGPSPLPPS